MTEGLVLPPHLQKPKQSPEQKRIDGIYTILKHLEEARTASHEMLIEGLQGLRLHGWSIALDPNLPPFRAVAMIANIFMRDLKKGRVQQEKLAISLGMLFEDAYNEVFGLPATEKHEKENQGEA